MNVYITLDNKEFNELDDAQSYAIKAGLDIYNIRIRAADGTISTYIPTTLWQRLTTTTTTTTGPTTPVVPTVGVPLGADSVQLPFSAMALDKQAALGIICGQSNTERGANIPAGEQKPASFFTDVFTLHYDNINTNATDESKWKWYPFTTNFDYNLGRKLGGHVYSMATSFALKWQERINAGAKLPKLYLIQISHSSFGFGMDPTSEQPAGYAYRSEFGGFNPLYNEKPQPVYQDIPIERFWDFIPRVHRWALNSLVKYNTKVRHLGVFWNQFEHDAVEANPNNYKDYLSSFLNNAFDRIAGAKVPFYYMYPNPPYFLVDKDAEKTRRLAVIRKAFEDLANERPNVTYFDVKTMNEYNATDAKLGVFVDGFHYIASIWKNYVSQSMMNWIEGLGGVTAEKRNNGLLVSSLNTATQSSTTTTSSESLTDRVSALEGVQTYKTFTIAKKSAAAGSLIGIWKRTPLVTGVANTDFVLYDSPEVKGAVNDVKEISLSTGGGVKTFYLMGLQKKSDASVQDNYVIANKVEVSYNDNNKYFKVIVKEIRAKAGADKYALTYNEVTELTATASVGEAMNWTSIITVKAAVAINFETLNSKLFSRKGLGTTTSLGTVTTTQPTPYDVLEVINRYLNTALTAVELSHILANRSAYKWEVLTGDRRGANPTLLGRIVTVKNWGGEDVVNKVLDPDPGTAESAPYAFTFTFSGATKKLKVTDTHGAAPDSYGAFRGLTITPA